MNTHPWTLIMIMNTHSWTLMNTHYDQKTHSWTLMNTHYDYEHSLMNTHYDQNTHSWTLMNTHPWTLMNTHYDQNTHSWTLMNTHPWTLMNTHYDYEHSLMNTHYDQNTHSWTLMNTHYDHEHSPMNTNEHSLWSWTLTSHHCLQWRHSEQVSFRQLGVHKWSTISIVLCQTEQIIDNMPRTKWQLLYTICVSLSVTTKLCMLTLQYGDFCITVAPLPRLLVYRRSQL